MTDASNVNNPDTAKPSTAKPSTAAHAQSTPAVALFGKMLTFTRIQLQTADLDSIAEQLATLLTTKNSQIPVVIDSEVAQDLPALVDLFWSWGLQPIGVVAGVLEESAKKLRLAIFPADGNRIKRIKPARKKTTTVGINQSITIKEPQVNTTNPDKSQTSSSASQQTQNLIEADSYDEGVNSLIYDQMLRSGQSINHVGGDLILTDSVNSGAEAISDNCLHIYGRAQGRLVAGATGDKEARIFCLRFNPSLVSVAGTYCLNDNIPAEFIDQPVQVSFKESEGLVFEILNTP